MVGTALCAFAHPTHFSNLSHPHGEEAHRAVSNHEDARTLRVPASSFETRAKARSSG